jgi:ferredoxin-NADP reductase
MTPPHTPELDTELVVRERHENAEGVVSLVLQDENGTPLPAWKPGAHIDLVLDDDLVRQYSLCSSPSDAGRWRIGVLLDPASRGGSAFVHSKLHEGVRVRVRGPRNHFALLPSKRYQFIGGGIGITPMLAMIEAAEAAGAEWSLLYGGRQRSSMAYLDELAGYGDRVTVWPQDEKGLLDLASVLGTPQEETLVYCCGPEPLLLAVEDACASWPDGSLHIERFAAKAASSEPVAGSLEHFTVECRSSGITVGIGPDDSILAVLRKEGINMLSSCGDGICGTCEAAVLEGTPDHRDSVLDDEEKAANDAMMVCVSRSFSPRLVLDL